MPCFEELAPARFAVADTRERPPHDLERLFARLTTDEGIDPAIGEEDLAPALEHGQRAQGRREQRQGERRVRRMGEALGSGEHDVVG